MELSNDTTSYFIIDNKDYVIDKQQSQWTIGPVSHTLVTEIIVTSTDIKQDKQKLLLSEYNTDGQIKIHVEASGIYNEGIPTGEFTYHSDKDPETFTYFRKDGLEYGLDFFGSVRYQDGFVHIKGELRPPYDKKPVFNIDVSVPFDPTLLDWRHYRFKSLAETAGADPFQVCFLEITNPSFHDLPAEIFDFTNLEYLSIVNKTNYWDNVTLPLENLGEQFGSLKKLKELSINKASIKQLPASFAELTALENINLSLCELQELPESVWTLPKLQYLILTNNKVKTIPTEIQLPALLTLSVENNQLHTLPETLIKQPKIRLIRASGNPFEHLPESFGFFKGLELTMPEKKRLLDTSYKGADGKGTVKWDDTFYEAIHDKTLIAPVEAIIKKNKLAKYKKALLSLAKRTVGFSQTEGEDYRETGNHRFGGRPDLPHDIPYPTFDDKDEKKPFHYEFIAQINCEQIAHLQDYLPRTGSLFFFFKSIHFLGTDDSDLAKVIYVDNNTTLSSGKRFTLQEEDFFELIDGQYTPYKAEAFVTVTAPSFYASRQNSYLFEGKAKSLVDQEELLEELYETYEEPVRLLKEFDHAINSYGFTQHESSELQAALNLKGNPQDWVILLLIKSRGDFQWGDAGDLFFVIHKSDLAKSDFSNVFVTMESS